MGREANSVVKLETTELYCGCNKATLPDSHTEHTHSTGFSLVQYGKHTHSTRESHKAGTQSILPRTLGELAHRKENLPL